LLRQLRHQCQLPLRRTIHLTPRRQRQLPCLPQFPLRPTTRLVRRQVTIHSETKHSVSAYFDEPDMLRYNEALGEFTEGFVYPTLARSSRARTTGMNACSRAPVCDCSLA
jgi:hypothetical protein